MKRQRQRTRSVNVNYVYILFSYIYVLNSLKLKFLLKIFILLSFTFSFDYKCDVHKVPKEARTVLVSELLKNITENDITIHFQRKKNSGGEVKEVELFSDKHEALVVFEDHKGKKKIDRAVFMKKPHIYTTLIMILIVQLLYIFIKLQMQL